MCKESYYQRVSNSWNDMFKIVANTKGVTVNSIYTAFKNLDTTLGKPWLGNIYKIKNKCIIWGPNSNGEYIYITDAKKGYISICHSFIPAWIEFSDEDEWRLQSKVFTSDHLDETIRYQFATMYILKDLTHKIKKYIELNIANVTPIDIGLIGKAYRFNETLNLLGDSFHVHDTNDLKLIEVKSKLPRKTFRIYWDKDGKEVFKLSKRIFHILPQYDLYENNVKIGRLKKKFDLVHDQFTSDTIYGRLKLISINSTLGKNFQVFMDDKFIGTIAESLNFTFKNALFDNFVMVVNEEKYLPLMTGMAVMVVREKKRDRETIGFEMR